jgi:hypothetical protein
VFHFSEATDFGKDSFREIKLQVSDNLKNRILERRFGNILI